MGFNNQGVPASQIPKGEDHLMRSIKDIERFITELTPSIARSIQPTVARLDAQAADLAAKQATLDSLLTKVVRTDAIFNSASNFSLATATATKVSLTITVPAGFTKAAVSVTGRVFAINDTAGADYVYADARINGVAGLGLPQVATGSGGSAMNVAPFSTTLSGLTGGNSFVVAVNAATSFAGWSASASNKADLSGTVSWYL